MSIVELHRHIECSLRPATLAELAQKVGISLYKNADDIRKNFWVTKPLDSLNDVLDRFVLFQRVLFSEEVLKRVGYEVVEDAFGEEIRRLELRYSPRFASETSKIPWENVLRAFQRGIQKAAQEIKTRTGAAMQVGLICIVSRGHEMGDAEEAIDFAIAHRKDFIAVDLAGPEIGNPCRRYKNIFRRAVDAGLPVTIHAGEACGPENVWEAIDLLGARRIGHGVRSIEDPELVRRLARDQILLETCPTSNVITRAVASWPQHPLPRLLEAGVPCSISTDDPGFFGVTMKDEFERCKKWMGMNESEINLCNKHAQRHSFLEMDKSVS